MGNSLRSRGSGVITAARVASRRAALAISPTLRRLTEEQSANRQQIVRLKADLASAQLWAPYGGDNYQYVFVVTYGRSGSTLLQGVLNSIDGYEIRGENREALFHLYRYHSTLESECQKNRRSEQLTPRDAWFGIDKYDPELAREKLRQLVTETVFQPSAGTRITGFKEIRWWHKEWNEYFNFLIDTFPNARFVINSRRFEDISKSKWWSKMEDPRARMDFFSERLAQIEEKLGDRAYHVNYDDYIANPNRLKGLFEWLGEPFDRARLDSVLALKHSS